MGKITFSIPHNFEQKSLLLFIKHLECLVVQLREQSIPAAQSMYEDGLIILLELSLVDLCMLQIERSHFPTFIHI